MMAAQGAQSLVLSFPADKWRWGCADILQRQSILPRAAADDVLGAGPSRRERALGVSHHSGGAAGSLHRGQERLHWDQVQLAAAPGWHREGSDPWWLHSWGTIHLWFFRNTGNILLFVVCWQVEYLHRKWAGNGRCFLRGVSEKG